MIKVLLEHGFAYEVNGSVYFDVSTFPRYGELARLELPMDQMDWLSDPDLRARLVAGIRAAGFEFVVLDLEGYRRGRMNEVRRVQDVHWRPAR